MKLTVKDILKHSFVITIDDDRLEWFKKVFKFHGLTPMPRKFPGTALWYNSPQYNCYLSHKNAILTAKKRKWDYVCIFEDDAYPISGVLEKMESYLKKLPDRCKVFSLGWLMLWDVADGDGDFFTSFQSYGSHAYIVFNDAYDRFIELLDKSTVSDGPFYSTTDDILPKDLFYAPKENLFIQYTNGKGMNNMGGYVAIDVKQVEATADNRWNILCSAISGESAAKMGFPLKEDIENKQADLPHTFNVLNGVNNVIPFVTVNAGTNTFTNITLKTIFKYHPNAKVFVIDVPKKDADSFHLIDEMPNVEVVKGVCWDNLDLPTIDLLKAGNLSNLERQVVVDRFGTDRLEVLPCGDYQHPINIQFALDTISEDGFILVDSDAPLISPVNSLMDRSVVTIAEEESWNYIHADRLQPLLNPHLNRFRFSPYIQYLNAKMIRDNGIKYFDANWLKDNLNQAGWFKNPDCGGRESVFFWTGSLFHTKVLESKLPFKTISTNVYVDHFGGATWQENSERHIQFIQKYIDLFNNKDALNGQFR